MDTAEKGEFSGLVFQKGCAEKYYKASSGIPLIVKVNGKSNLTTGDVISFGNSSPPAWQTGGGYYNIQLGKYITKSRIKCYPVYW